MPSYHFSYAKNEGEYFCEACDYKCNKKFLWKQHINTKKHKDNKMVTKNMHTTSPTTMKEESLVCPECGKAYKYASGLSRHRKLCVKKALKDEDVQHLISILGKDAELKNEMMEQLKEQSTIIKGMVPCLGNNNNNRFNINVFLNEQCRDAINMSEFLASLQIQLKDLEYTQINGLVEGISSVLVNGLKQLDTCKRPIHCTDMKRETLYIKENDEWDREQGKSRLRSAIENVADKQRKAIADWEESHPGWEESEKGKEEYLKLVKSIMSDISQESDENKIIKNIAKETVIDK